MSSVNTGVSMKVSFVRKGYAIDAYKSMAYANQQALQLTSAVSRSYCRIRAGVACPCKARPARNTRCIANGCNAAGARYARSRRARLPWPVATLRPWAMGGAIPGGARLATNQGRRADATI